MQHFPSRINQQILKMSIADTEKVSNCAVSSARIDVVLHDCVRVVLNKFG